MTTSEPNDLTALAMETLTKPLSRPDFTAAKELCAYAQGVSIPRLSQSIAKTLLDKSPLHAWTEHRLLGGVKSEPSDAMVEGTVFEALIVGICDEVVEVVEGFDAWRSNAAKEAKAAAIEAGKIPILAHKIEPMEVAAARIREAIAERLPGGLDGIEWKKRVEWTSRGGCHCSGELDGLRIMPNGYQIIDLKKCENAHPSTLSKKVTADGWHVQQAAYMEAINTLHPEYAGHGTFWFCCYEVNPPYAVTVCTLEGVFAELGERRWDNAKRIWKQCIETNKWPGYGTTTLEALPWQAAELERYSSL